MQIKGASPLRRDAAANRERLIQSALDVFNAEGLDAGVEQIARHAGVGVGTLYRRFPTKAALIDFLVDALLVDMTEAAATSRDVADGGGLEHFVRSTADLFSASRCCLTQLWADDTRDYSLLRRRISLLLRDAQDAGALRRDVNRADITSVIWSLRGIVAGAGDDAARSCQRHLDYVFAGMR